MDTEPVDLPVVDTPPPAPPVPAANADLGYVEPELAAGDRTGVPLVPMISSLGWVTDLLATAAWAVAGPAGVATLVVGGIAGACAIAGAGKRYRKRPAQRAGAARPPGRGASTRSGLGTTGLAGGRRSGGSGGGSGSGSRGGLRGLASRGRSTGSGGSGAGRSATGTRSGGKGGLGRILGKAGAGSAGRRGTGSGSSGGGKSSGRSFPRLGRGSGGGGIGASGSGRRGVLGMRRASGSGGRAAGSGLAGGKGPAARLRRAMGLGGRAGTGVGSSTGATGARRRLSRLLGRKPAAGSTPAVARTQRFPWLRSANWRRRATAPNKKAPHVGTKVATPPKPGSGDGKKTTASAPPPAGRPIVAPPGTHRPTARTGGTSMSGKLQVTDMSNDMASNMAGVTVERGEMYPFLLELERVLPETNDNIVRMWNGLGSAMSGGMPVHPTVVALLDTIAAAQRSIGDTVAELPRIVRTFHEADFARHEAPRVNEEAWDRT